jgi:hypothetical protein
MTAIENDDDRDQIISTLIAAGRARDRASVTRPVCYFHSTVTPGAQIGFFR